ncbi:MAG: triose-phosphate isomerase [Fimbriimonadaceae bacterium]|nr:triose-phosphate isomerase [Fimbriimonadaceae bacterium]
MSKRVAVAAANWKMNKTCAEAATYMADLKALLPTVEGTAEVVIFAPFTALATVAAGGSSAGVGGQDVFWMAAGAYTGEISLGMLQDVGCTHVLVGHSERRRRFGKPEPELAGDLGCVFGDNDATVNKKLTAVVAAGLVGCLCVGETLAERQAGQTDRTIEAQLRAGLAGLDAAAVANTLIAYEPVWAIGTGEVCQEDEAERVCAMVRGVVAALYDQATADTVRVLYGGSMSGENVDGLLCQPNIDGGLVGGASLTVAKFEPIIRRCAKG